MARVSNIFRMLNSVVKKGQSKDADQLSRESE